jgi:hypothetical protein
MSNSQSKQVAYDDCDGEYDYDYTLTHDKLVAYFEEFIYGSKESVMTCYVLYDHRDKEYYICGKRTATCGVVYSETHPEYNVNEYNDFKFFCKSSKDMVNMLKLIMNVSCNDVNMTMYNYKDIFMDEEGVELDYIDFNTLQYSNVLQKEIISYDNTRFNEGIAKTMLRMLKKMRY